MKLTTPVTLPPCKLIWGQRWTSHSSNAIYKDSIKILMLSFALGANVCINTITHLLVKNYNEFMHLANALVWMQFGTNMLVIQIKCYLIQIQWMQLIQNIILLNPYINKSTDFLNDHFKLDRSPYVLICRGSVMIWVCFFFLSLSLTLLYTHSHTHTLTHTHLHTDTYTSLSPPPVCYFNQRSRYFAVPPVLTHLISPSILQRLRSWLSVGLLYIMHCMCSLVFS